MLIKMYFLILYNLYRCHDKFRFQKKGRAKSKSVILSGKNFKYISEQNTNEYGRAEYYTHTTLEPVNLKTTRYLNI